MIRECGVGVMGIRACGRRRRGILISFGRENKIEDMAGHVSADMRGRDRERGRQGSAALAVCPSLIFLGFLFGLGLILYFRTHFIVFLSFALPAGLLLIVAIVYRLYLWLRPRRQELCRKASLLDTLDLGHGTAAMLQSRSAFRAGEDSVCLAHAGLAYVRALGDCSGAKRERLFLDLGAGAGFVGILLALLCQNLRGILVEWLPGQAYLAGVNIRRTGLEKRLRWIETDARDYVPVTGKQSAWMAARSVLPAAYVAALQDRAKLYREACGERCPPSLAVADLRAQAASVDLLLCNPPYRRTTGKALAEMGNLTAVARLAPSVRPDRAPAQDPERFLARWDYGLQAADIARSAAFFLRPDGRAIVLYPSEREHELCQAFAEEAFYLCRRRRIRYRRDKEKNMTLYHFARLTCAEEGELVLREADGSFTAEAARYYLPEAMPGKAEGETTEGELT